MANNASLTPAEISWQVHRLPALERDAFIAAQYLGQPVAWKTRFFDAGSARHLARWSARQGVDEPRAFARVRDEAVRGDEIAPTAGALRLLEGLERYLEARVHRSAQADRVEARGRRVVFGLVAAYLAGPGLLDDHVLLRYKEAAGVPFWRDLPRLDRDAGAGRGYRDDPRFARIVADHVAAMTYAYAIGEFARLLEIGAVPIPSAEQLRREERP